MAKFKDPLHPTEDEAWSAALEGGAKLLKGTFNLIGKGAKFAMKKAKEAQAKSAEKKDAEQNQ